jgi:hypothetical protein
MYNGEFHAFKKNKRMKFLHNSCKGEKGYTLNCAAWNEQVQLFNSGILSFHAMIKSIGYIKASTQNHHTKILQHSFTHNHHRISSFLIEKITNTQTNVSTKTKEQLNSSYKSF